MRSDHWVGVLTGTADVFCAGTDIVSGPALELAAEVCASSPASVRSTLQALDEQWVADEAVGWDATARAVQRIQAGPDLDEGLAAFAEKRSPR